MREMLPALRRCRLVSHLRRTEFKVCSGLCSGSSINSCYSAGLSCQRRTNRLGRCRASIENSVSCHGLTAARNQGPEGQDIEIGDTASQRCRPPIHCPCGSLTTKSRKGSRQGGCPRAFGKPRSVTAHAASPQREAGIDATQRSRFDGSMELVSEAPTTDFGAESPLRNTGI